MTGLLVWAGSSYLAVGWVLTECTVWTLRQQQPPRRLGWLPGLLILFAWPFFIDRAIRQGRTPK
jgi:hypothetical protein